VSFLVNTSGTPHHSSDDDTRLPTFFPSSTSLTLRAASRIITTEYTSIRLKLQVASTMSKRTEWQSSAALCGLPRPQVDLKYPQSRPYILLCEIVLQDCDLLLYYAFPHTLLLTYMITCDILHTSCGIALGGPRQSGSTGFHRYIAMLYKTPCLSFRSIFCRNSHPIFDLLFATFYLLHNLSPPRP
jgi:hypothetical protein